MLLLSTVTNFASKDTLVFEVNRDTASILHYGGFASITLLCFFLNLYLIMFTMLGLLAVVEQPGDSTLHTFAVSVISKKQQQKNCGTVKGLEVDYRSEGRRGCQHPVGHKPF